MRNKYKREIKQFKKKKKKKTKNPPRGLPNDWYARGLAGLL